MRQLPISDREYDSAKRLFRTIPALTNRECVELLWANKQAYGIHLDRPYFGVNYLVRQASQQLKGEARAMKLRQT
jgi:hypothetical protein